MKIILYYVSIVFKVLLLTVLFFIYNYFRMLYRNYVAVDIAGLKFWEMCMKVYEGV